MRSVFLLSFVVVVTACGTQPQALDSVTGNAESEGGVERIPSSNQVESSIPNEIVLKLRVFQLRFPSAANYNSSFSSDTIKQYIASTNEIYKQAGIRFVLESIQTLDAPSSVAFTASETNQTFVQKIQKIQFPAVKSGTVLFNVAFFYGFPISAKGLYVPNQKVAYVGEYFLKTGELQGAVVMAHELGHQLSLEHANASGQACADSNLLCTGGTGIGEYLTPEQIAAVRRQALIGPMVK